MIIQIFTAILCVSFMGSGVCSTEPRGRDSKLEKMAGQLVLQDFGGKGAEQFRAKGESVLRGLSRAASGVESMESAGLVFDGERFCGCYERYVHDFEREFGEAGLAFFSLSSSEAGILRFDQKTLEQVATFLSSSGFPYSSFAQMVIHTIFVYRTSLARCADIKAEAIACEGDKLQFLEDWFEEYPLNLQRKRVYEKCFGEMRSAYMDMVDVYVRYVFKHVMRDDIRAWAPLTRAELLAKLRAKTGRRGKK